MVSVAITTTTNSPRVMMQQAAACKLKRCQGRRGCLCPTKPASTGPVWAGVMEQPEQAAQRTNEEKQRQLTEEQQLKAEEAERQRKEEAEEEALLQKVTEEALKALSGSPFAALDASRLLWLVTEQPVDEDDALCVALVCRRFRDAVFQQYPRRPDGHKYAGKRFLTTIRASVLSVGRITWMSAMSDGPPWLPWSPTACMYAALEGDEVYSTVMPFMRSHGCDWSEFTYKSSSPPAYVPVNPPITQIFNCDQEGLYLEPEPSMTRVKSFAQLEVCRWALENHCDWNELIQWARASGCDFHELRQWATFNLCDEDEFSYRLAAKRGNLAMLKWCRENAVDDSRWDYFVFEAALVPGKTQERFEIVHWLLANDCPTADGWAICDSAARGGHMEILTWAHGEGYPCDFNAFRSAAHSGNVEMMAWMRAKDCGWSEEACTSAAAAGNLDALKWLHAEGAPWNARACAAAAYEGNLPLLQWLREHDAPWDTYTCVAAATASNLEMLQWLRANSCPWDWRTCRAAAELEHHQVLAWAKANGLQEEWAEHVDALESGDSDVYDGNYSSDYYAEYCPHSN